MALPVNVRDVLHGGSVEWERLECKVGWNPLEVLRAADLQHVLDVRDDDHLRTRYLRPMLKAGLLELTDPAAPRSPKQRYRDGAWRRSASVAARLCQALTALA